MTLPKTSYVLTAFLLLTACATAEERSARLAAQDISTCKESGFKEGTDAFASCRLQVRLARDQRNKKSLEDAVDSLNKSVQSNSSLPRVTHCNSYVGLSGNNVSTSCY